MTPLIIDCDPGVDDALALLVALGSEELDLLAVTTVAGNRPVDVTYRNASRLLTLAGRPDIPVYRGCERPMAHVEARSNLFHGADGLGGIALADGQHQDTTHAVDALIQLLTTAPVDSITVVAIGPLTNLAMAEVLHPGLLRRSKALLIMGGAASCPGNVTPHAEFNFHCDALAAHVVLNAGARVTLFGLDVTSQAVMSHEWIASMPLQTRCGKAAHDMLVAYASADPLLHDACPVAYLIEPGLFSGETCIVSVDYRHGATEGLLTALKREDAASTARARVLTDLYADRLLALVRRCLDKLP